MTGGLSPNTQAILLLTAPLLAGRRGASVAAEPLASGEYNRFARRLQNHGCEPADLLDARVAEILEHCADGLDPERLQRLLGRGFLLAQAVTRWHGRAIWAMSRADAGYPRRVRERLKGQSPPILYGFGEPWSLDRGGLAVVGSRKAEERLIDYAQAAGRLAAEAERALISGGARGIDRAAMTGALQAGGKAVAVLADGLERAVMRREDREALMDGKLVLVCPYDPASAFTVGRAMGRNKLVYALADAALVVQSEYGKGGTWHGAAEQLEKFGQVPVYVRSTVRGEKGLEGLRELGARPWRDPATPQALQAILDEVPPGEGGVSGQGSLFPDLSEEPRRFESLPRLETDLVPQSRLFAKVRSLLAKACAATPRREGDIASVFMVSKTQTRDWLARLTSESVLEKQHRPACYRASEHGEATLFPVSDRELCGDLFAEVRALLMQECGAGPKSIADIAAALCVSPGQARDWLQRLASEGALEKQRRPVRYCTVTRPG